MKIDLKLYYLNFSLKLIVNQIVKELQPNQNSNSGNATYVNCCANNDHAQIQSITIIHIARKTVFDYHCHQDLAFPSQL